MTDDGLCAVDVDLIFGKLVSRSSERMLGKGAVKVLEGCIGDGHRPNTGGVARDFGMYIRSSAGWPFALLRFPSPFLLTTVPSISSYLIYDP